MKRTLLQKAAKLLVALQLMVGLAPSGFNLCVAADGHTALEVSHAEFPCVRDIERHHPGKQVIAADEFERHPCEDLPLFETGPYRGTDTVRLVPPMAPIFPAPVLAAHVSSRTVLHVVTSVHLPLELMPRARRSVIFLV